MKRKPATEVVKVTKVERESGIIHDYVFVTASNWHVETRIRVPLYRADSYPIGRELIVTHTLGQKSDT